jgi:aminomethyltransferase
VGDVTSACLSPTLGRAIAMAYVETALSTPGTKLAIDTGRAGETLSAEVTTLPFYKAPKAG